MAKKSSTYKRTKKAPKWQLPLLLILVLVAVGFGVFIVFFSRANTNSPQVYLTTSNTSAANATTNIGGSGGFTYGIGGDKIIACNWDGANYGTTNVDTIGAYRPSTSQFFLNNNNGSNPASLSFTFGSPNDVPICGSWYSNPDTKATVGVFRNGTFYLASSNTNGGGTVKDVNIGANGGDVPLACDWNGDGKTDLGYYRPSEGKFYLYLWYGSWSKVKEFQYGPANNLTRYPICGNWDGATNNGGTFDYDTVGFYDTTNGTFYLRNTNSASADIAAGATVTKFADPNTLKLAPVTGRFSAGPTTFIGGYTITQLAAPAPTTTTTTTTPGGAGGSAAPADPCAGDLGANIKQLQTCLNSKGANLSVDGQVGPLTKTACINILKDKCPANVVNYGVSSGSTPSRLAGQTVTSYIEGATIASLCNNYNVMLFNAITVYNRNVTLYDRVWTSPTGTWRNAQTTANRQLYTASINKLKNLAINCDINVNPYISNQYIYNQFSLYNELREVLNKNTNLLNTLPPLS